MLQFVLKHPKANYEMLGIVPYFVDPLDKRPARDQFHDNYIGGWVPIAGFEMREDALKYPGDPAFPLIAEAKFRDEIVRFYAGAWVAVVQPDGSFEVTRMD